MTWLIHLQDLGSAYSFVKMPSFYHIVEPSGQLAITGPFVDNVLIRKKRYKLPFQKVCNFSLTPSEYSIELQAMTIEKLNFSLPAVFTIVSA
jgi:flotillin